MLCENKIFTKIADFFIQVNYLQTKHLLGLGDKGFNIAKTRLANFLIEKPPKIDFVIDVIENVKRKILVSKNRKELFIDFIKIVSKNHIQINCMINFSEFDIVLHTILNKLFTNQNTFFLHASSLNIKNNAFLFLGESESGKSTICSLLGKKYAILADEELIIKYKNNYLYCFQTPFLEKINFHKDSRKYLVSKIFFIKKADNFKLIKIINKRQILNLFYKQILNKKTVKFEVVENILTKGKDLNFFYFYFKNNEAELLDFATNNF